jgi:NADH-quinone oxidoreductase subunit C
MNQQEIYNILKEQFADKIISLKDSVKDPFIVIDAASIKPIMQHLKNNSDLAFDFLACITGLDYTDKFTVVYHLFSCQKRHKIVIKVHLPNDSPEIESVESIWKAANWLERETYDLLGIKFVGHSNLRRILLPEDWTGYPLRKDYTQPEEYHGWPNQ